jgi:uncharacterized protein (TIGR02452 family)
MSYAGQRLHRDARRALAEHTVTILEEGVYEAPDGEPIDITDEIARCVRGTVEYPPDAELPELPEPAYETEIEVRRESSLEAGRRLWGEDEDPAILNFASAYHPGGGFLSGARAQEESLARSSALYASLREADMYAYHERRGRDPMYTNYAIYTPGTPVFREDAGALLSEPWSAGFVTSPAPNAGVVLERDPERRDEVSREMRARIEKVLTIMAGRGHRRAVLGAWGCGVFGNDPQMVAGHFADVLEGPLTGRFERVAFAILDGTDDDRIVGPFEEAFAAG